MVSIADSLLAVDRYIRAEINRSGRGKASTSDPKLFALRVYKCLFSGK